MYNFSDLKKLNEDELREEYTLVNEYQDRLVGLGTTLGITAEGCLALCAIYNGQKGHEVFLMAIDVVEKGCAARGVAVAARLQATMRYTDQILVLLGVEPPPAEEWPSYEAAPSEDDTLSSLKEKDENTENQ
jgi:hypothetical protein